MSEPIGFISRYAVDELARGYPQTIHLTASAKHCEPLYTASLNQPSPLVKAEALALLDSAFEEEFDLLPEDAKQLCDTFYRSLRKRLGHPVECSGKSPGAAGGGTA